MKESEYILKEMQFVENDYEFWNLQEKLDRARREEDFFEFHFKKIKESDNVKSVELKQGMVKINFLNGVVFDFYYKKDSACLPKEKNKWIKKGALQILLSKI